MANQNIPDCLPRGQRIPAGKRASDRIPVEIREMVEHAAESLKGRHGYIYGLTLNRLVQPCFMAAQSEDEGRYLVGCLIAAFIEIAGLDENRITDPFFAAFYRQSAKASHVKAARACIRRHGGWEPFRQMLTGELDKHPHLREARSPMFAMPGSNIEPKSPEGPRQSLDRIISIAKDMLETQGEVSPLFAVLDGNGRGVMFMMPGSGTKDEIAAFYGNADQAGRAVVAGASRFVRASESWVSENTVVRPSLSDTRREAVTIVLWDDNENVVGDLSSMDIERDADGKPHAGKIDYSIGESKPADFSKSGFGVPN